MDSLEDNKRPILTKREKEILQLVAEGKAYKTIAADLRIKPMTVKNHASSIYRKLGAVSQANAVYKYFFERHQALDEAVLELIDTIKDIGRSHDG